MSNTPPPPKIPLDPEWEKIKRREEKLILEQRAKNDKFLARNDWFGKLSGGLGALFGRGLDALLWKWVSNDVEQARIDEERRQKKKEPRPSRYRPAPPDDSK